MAESPAIAYQSLYRRYRPRRFGEVRGQEHVVAALRNAVRDDRVGHAYLFSGPRGTGKTTSARILAKVLNCEAPVDGEPCLECESCLAVEAGRSFDLHELDAASNNKVENVRDLIERVAYSTPGRTKVYILDEVHMLTPAASAALLKTLEEPPPGVVFVLATTDPQKVLATIRSRTQHLDFGLLPAADLEEYVRHVVTDAGLDVGDDAIADVLRVGGGSARDTLSALDQVAAAGGVGNRGGHADELVDAIVERDTGRVLAVVAEAVSAGRDAKVLAAELVGRLRDVFLAAMKAPLDHLHDTHRERAATVAERAERALVTRAIEVIGEALVEMREAPDPRVTFEVALVRITDLGLDTSVAALVDRVERLERALAGGPPPTGASTTSSPPAPAAPSPPTAASPPSAAAPQGRAALGAHRSAPLTGGAASAPAPVTAAAPATATAPAQARAASATAVALPSEDLPTRDELTLAWGDAVLPTLRGPAKARFSGGRFIGVEAGAALFALPNAIHRQRCEDVRPEVEAALAGHFGRPVPLQLVVEGVPATGMATDDPPTAAVAAADESDDIAPGEVRDLPDAPDGPANQVELLREQFPGAVVEEG